MKKILIFEDEIECAFLRVRELPTHAINNRIITRRTIMMLLIFLASSGFYQQVLLLA